MIQTHRGTEQASGGYEEHRIQEKAQSQWTQLSPLLQPQERQGRSGLLCVGALSQWLDQPRPTFPTNPLPSVAL